MAHPRTPGELVNKRSLLVPLVLLATLAGCDDDDKKKRLEAMGTPKPSAPPPWASAASSAPAPEASAAPEPPVKLTGDKKLRDRLQGGKWFKKITPAQEAENKAELERAEAALKSAKNESERRAAKARKITVEEITLSWTEFSPKKRTTKAPPIASSSSAPTRLSRRRTTRSTSASGTRSTPRAAWSSTPSSATTR